MEKNKIEPHTYRELDRCLRDQEYEQALDLILKCKLENRYSAIVERIGIGIFDSSP
jgi:hypothetical protein